MAGSKLYDYNSSFSLMRANPSLSGNIKIVVNSSGDIFLDSFNANSTLSSDTFKAFKVSGDQSYAEDLYAFFQSGQVDPSVVFEVCKTTKGDIQATKKIEEQYDHFYWSGAETLIDRNYTEDFSYLAPLWIKSEIPDFFVIFKVPDPISYKYSENQTAIQAGVTYKVIKNFNSDSFSISYGTTPGGDSQIYSDGEFFIGSPGQSAYSVVSGEGSVCIYEELLNLSNVEDASSYFENKILPNCQAIKTFDLRSGTKIGNYVRGIFNTLTDSYSPVNINFGNQGYTYFNGIDYRNGVYTRASEFASDYFVSSNSTPQIDLENYITSGFSRNGIICPSLLNLTFLFDDPDAEDFSINRYFGAYVSRNDLGEFVLNGSFLYEFKDLVGNENYPKPSRDFFGYYYDNDSYVQGATSGVRIFYEGASGFMPGASNVNISQEYKLFYITDKNENFYSLKRLEGWTPSDSEYSFGPYLPSSDSFGVTGSTGATAGNFVIQNQSVDLLNFTGVDDKILSCQGIDPGKNGTPYIDIEFTNLWENSFNDLVFKIYWPNGSRKEGSERYDLIKSGDFSSNIVWIEGSSYSSGNNYFFNAETGLTSDVANAFRNSVYAISDDVWDCGVIEAYGSTCVIRSNSQSGLANSSYSVTVFDEYDYFVSKYKSIHSQFSAYSVGDIVKYENKYYQCILAISQSTTGDGALPTNTTYWSEYYTFSKPGYLKIKGSDPAGLNYNFTFQGGTSFPKTRVVFPIENSAQVIVGNYIKTKNGFSVIKEIDRYVDEPLTNDITGLVYDFNNYETYLVAIVGDIYAQIYYSYDNTFNVFSSAKCNTGVFTFFDFKDFDFDFWSSSYGITPNYETYRYFSLLPDTDSIESGVLYIVKQGTINYNGTQYTAGQTFNGVVGVKSFEALDQISAEPIVFPFQFSDLEYSTTGYDVQNIGYETDLNKFQGFIGIGPVENVGTPLANASKEDLFNFGLLSTEYAYLQENYTIERSNLSRIVPFVSKWAYKNGTDSRGNRYRLNASPAFTPSNFSPTTQNFEPDPKYLTHEWFLLESVPRQFPVEFMKDQYSYLPTKINLETARSASPSNSLYLPKFFTVVPEDYSSAVRDVKDSVKEMFSEFFFNEENGYYETLFRGVKVTLKKRSNADQSTSNADVSKYIQNYRGYEGYRYSCLLRVVPEDDSLIQAPVSYEFIENNAQKFVVFVVTIVANDQKLQPLGYTGGTGGDPIIDYTLLYSLSDKNELNPGPVVGSRLYSIADIKLSCGLNLSNSSDSVVNTSTNPGVIYYLPNPSYETDLRDEINLTFPIEAALNPGQVSNGPGSFSVPSISSTYPWPTGVGESFVEFGPVEYNNNYEFVIPFSFSSPVEVPVGSRFSYENKPVFQLDGGGGYFDFILNRTSFSYVSNRVNGSNSYVSYNSYFYSDSTGTEYSKSNDFEIYFESPSYIVKYAESSPVKVYSSVSATASPGRTPTRGPITQDANQVTSYSVAVNPFGVRSDLLRYSGKYEPIFNKVIYFGSDKTDTIPNTGVDLSFRNCTFNPLTYGFGKIKNLSYTKVSDNNILFISENLPSGPRYPLIGQTPISRKDFNVFQSSWDTGYYDKYITATTYSPIAGTKAMVEFKSLLGSKIMKTPKNIISNNYLVVPISNDEGISDVAIINSEIDGYISQIQGINASNSATGIGTSQVFLTGLNIDTLSPNLFPNSEIIWQKINATTIKGIIRVDRILRRSFMNEGAGTVFFENIISEFGVGDPGSIQDDVLNYLDTNILPSFNTNNIQLYVKKTGSSTIEYKDIVRGDIYSPDRGRLGYVLNNNYNLTKNGNLSYSFEFIIDPNFQYSLSFRILIDKI